ncbi:hypothetical protein [Stenotrophomonas tumulicola]|uniref:Uncharacterized protein n=1 Tax=Stenotrophomonas tumulicola TaxID=1685415 RepID=A0A7W3FNN2_9GAMM|nr:hypothetical protein [Stenotrophomonas tumulicola]MBA8682931.1 hypothetical protein [Stenotrophomonas tumulicola]
MNDQPGFELVLPLLQAAREQTITGLRHSPADPVLRERLRQLDRAMGCLQLCAAHLITGSARISALPWAGNAFGSYGVIELDEEGEPATGALLQLNGQQVDLLPGDLLVQGVGPPPGVDNA